MYDKILYQRAIDVIKKDKKATIPYFQRRLQLKYAEAYNLVNQLEKKGILGKADGSKPREIFWDKIE